MNLRTRIDALARQVPRTRAALVYYRAGEEEAPELAPGEVVMPLFSASDPLGPGAVPEEYEERDDDEELTR